MIEEFVSLGKWWLPSKPEVVVPGKLIFSPGIGIELELIGSFYDSQFQETDRIPDFSLPDNHFSAESLETAEQGTHLRFIKPEETIILGLLESNEEITLYKCFGQVGSFEFVKGRSKFLFQATYIFRKVHFQSEEDIKFKSISVRYSHLEEWIEKSGVQAFWSSEENKVWISYQPPESIHLTEINDLNISISFSKIYINPFDLYFGAAYYTGSVEQKTQLTVQNLHDKPIDQCVELIVHFRDLLSFAMTKPPSIISVSGNVNVIYETVVQKDDETYESEEKIRETQVLIMFALWNSEKYSETKISPHDMLFSYSDVDGRLGEVFKNWIIKKEEHEATFELLMTTIHTPDLYLHYVFLNLIQAIEVYHANKYEGTYQNDCVFKEGIFKRLLETIEGFPGEEVDQECGISEDFRAALKGKLNFQNQVTLQTRLSEILESAVGVLPQKFLDSEKIRKDFARRASNTRHALTHHSRTKRKNAARGKELLQLSHTLTVILQICLLRELDFSDDSIERIVGRNRNYQREWRSSSD